MVSKKRKKKSRVKKKKQIKKRNPYASALALRNGSGYHTSKKYNRNLEKKKAKRESEQE